MCNESCSNFVQKGTSHTSSRFHSIGFITLPHYTVIKHTNICAPVPSLRCPPGFIPVCSLGMSQVGLMNLGKDASSFKYYTMCGLQEGFEPFAVNMNREITMWFSKRLPTFVNIPQDHADIEVFFSFL